MQAPCNGSRKDQLLNRREHFGWRRRAIRPFTICRADDADMSLLVRTTHAYTHCPYKGDCTYYSIPIGGTKSEYAVWTYETPYAAVASIREYLAFYPSRVDAIEVMPESI
jgi:uncharacterized protein (DUF427 family)